MYVVYVFLYIPVLVVCSSISGQVNILSHKQYTSADCMVVNVLVLLVHMYLCPTVRADITGIRTVPDSPIEGTDTGCLSAGKDVDIVCDNMAFPVATVLFFKDGTEIDVEADERCV